MSDQFTPHDNFMAVVTVVLWVAVFFALLGYAIWKIL